MYTVIYRMGGPEHCVWRRTFVGHTHKAMAEKMAAELEKSGYKAVVWDTGQLNNIGLPIGWQAYSVNWHKDEIETSKYRTLHIPAA